MSHFTSCCQLGLLVVFNNNQNLDSMQISVLFCTKKILFLYPFIHPFIDLLLFFPYMWSECGGSKFKHLSPQQHFQALLGASHDVPGKETINHPCSWFWIFLGVSSHGLCLEYLQRLQHFSCLYQGSCPFGCDPYLMTKSEGWNRDQ